MPGNESVLNAKKEKNDEFYTQLSDIAKEMQAYLDYDPDVFRNKTILLPCDDPEWSNFTLYFAQNFELFGLKKLISTSYALESKRYKGYQPTLFETESEQFNPTIDKTNGKIFTLTREDGKTEYLDFKDLKWEYLQGDGDFKSSEVRKLRDEADIIITNPPFSLYSDFIHWLFETNKKFSIIGSIGSISYRDIFPLFMQNKMWCGNGFNGGNAYFRVPDDAANEYADGVYNQETGMVKFRNCAWFTNIDFGKRHKKLDLMTMEENIKYSKHSEIRENGYKHYYNYDAIDVPYVDAIPSDYDGVMGVPTSFMERYNPDQFEIIGNGPDVPKTILHTVVGNEIHFIDKQTGNVKYRVPYSVKERKAGNGLRIDEDGIPGASPFNRIMIRRKQ